MAIAGSRAIPTARRASGRARWRRGRDAETLAAAALAARGWEIKARRVRTKAGEIDLIAEKDGLLAFVEVKRRQRLPEAAAALSQAQRARLLGAAEIVLAQHPTWGRAGVRFDLITIDSAGSLRRIRDAFRLE